MFFVGNEHTTTYIEAHSIIAQRRKYSNITSNDYDIINYSYSDKSYYIIVATHTRTILYMLQTLQRSTLIIRSHTYMTWYTSIVQKAPE